MRRAAMLAVALVGTLVCAALLVREVTLAASHTVVWSAPRWWHDLLTAPAGLVALAGVAAAALGIGCLWLALRMLAAGEPDEGAGIELAAGPTSVVVKAAALEHLLAHRLVDEVAEINHARVWVTRRDGRLVTHTSLSLAATDLRRLHARVQAVVQSELRAATGLDTGELTVEVDELLVGRGGVT